MNLLSAFDRQGKVLPTAILILLENVKTIPFLNQDDEGCVVPNQSIRVPFHSLTPQQERAIATTSIKDDFYTLSSCSRMEVTFGDDSRLVLDMSTYLKGKEEEPEIPEELQELFKSFKERFGGVIQE